MEARAFGKFQSTRPRGARQPALASNAQRISFQSTRPRGARPQPHAAADGSEDFNPRAHEGRDQSATNEKLCLAISIHAPTRGATVFNARTDKCLLISIHAPTRGATSPARCGLDAGRFQSTRPRGARPAKSVRSTRRRISIHAPTRGATPTSAGTRSESTNFNPRAHEGRDGRDCLTCAMFDISIHAPTRGATVVLALPIVRGGFQSTRPRGARRAAAR